jgi:hypothetical protein
MALPVYITSSEYNTYTGRSAVEAATHRIAIASRLLDARIVGYEMIDEDVMDELTEEQQYAIKYWTSCMVTYLYENKDRQPDKTYIRLGRFEQRNNTGATTLFGTLAFADKMLQQAGLCGSARAML